MEIRTKITGIHGEEIEIVAQDATEYNTALNTLVQPLTVEIPAKTTIASFKHVTPMQLKEMRAYKKEGMPIPKIAEKMNIAYSTAWKYVRKIQTAEPKSKKELMELTRLRHQKKTPDYHRDCPCCDPSSTTTYEDWLARSKQARTDRLLSWKRQK